MMRPFLRTLTLLAFFLPASGCEDMHRQPSVKPQEPPRLSAPAAAVPVQGKIPVEPGEALQNPLLLDQASIDRGAELYQINCALCHGTRDTFPGKVGGKMHPPPPDLRDQRIRELSDSDLFQRITFGFGRMPPFELRIGYTDRWHIVNYMKTFGGPRRGFLPHPAEEEPPGRRDREAPPARKFFS